MGDKKIGCDVLMICAQNDYILPPSMSEGMEHLVEGKLERVVINNCGHFILMERPNEVNHEIFLWLNKK